MGIHTRSTSRSRSACRPCSPASRAPSARSPSSSSPPTASRVPFDRLSRRHRGGGLASISGLSRRPVHPVHPEHRRRDLEGPPGDLRRVHDRFVYLMPPASQAPSACFGRGGDPMKPGSFASERCWQRSPFRPRQKKYDPGASDTRSRSATPTPTAVRRRRTHDRQDHRRLFQDGERSGRHQRRR